MSCNTTINEDVMMMMMMMMTMMQSAEINNLKCKIETETKQVDTVR